MEHFTSTFYEHHQQTNKPILHTSQQCHDSIVFWSQFSPTYFGYSVFSTNCEMIEEKMFNFVIFVPLKLAQLKKRASNGDRG